MAPIGVIRPALPAHTDQYKALAGWVAGTAPASARVLDVGSGDGDDQYSSRIRGIAAASLVSIRARLGNEPREQRLANSRTVIKLGRKWTHTAADRRGCWWMVKPSLLGAELADRVRRAPRHGLVTLRLEK